MMFVRSRFDGQWRTPELLALVQGSGEIGRVLVFVSLSGCGFAGSVERATMPLKMGIFLTSLRREEDAGILLMR